MTVLSGWYKVVVTSRVNDTVYSSGLLLNILEEHIASIFTSERGSSFFRNVTNNLRHHNPEDHNIKCSSGLIITLQSLPMGEEIYQGKEIEGEGGEMKENRMKTEK
jgi:hypothetical protein